MILRDKSKNNNSTKDFLDTWLEKLKKIQEI